MNAGCNQLIDCSAWRGREKPLQKTIHRTGIFEKKGATLLPQHGDWVRLWPASEQCKITRTATEHCCWRLKKQLLCRSCTMLNHLNSTWWWDRVHHVSVTASHIHHHTGPYCRQDGDSHCCVNGLPIHQQLYWTKLPPWTLLPVAVQSPSAKPQLKLLC